MILHYIYDPLCGWCYGAKPLVEAAQVSAAGDRPCRRHDERRQPPSAFRRNCAITSCPTTDASPSTPASLLAKRISKVCCVITRRCSIRRHRSLRCWRPKHIDRPWSAQCWGVCRPRTTWKGDAIADAAVLLELAMQMGYAQEDFHLAFESVDSESHIKDSRQFLAQVGGQGFPTMALEQDGTFQLIDISPWLGKPQAFADWLRQAIVAR